MKLIKRKTQLIASLTMLNEYDPLLALLIANKCDFNDDDKLKKITIELLERNPKVEQFKLYEEIILKWELV